MALLDERLVEATLVDALLNEQYVLGMAGCLAGSTVECQLLTLRPGCGRRGRQEQRLVECHALEGPTQELGVPVLPR
jgi:hypothetical protein